MVESFSHLTLSDFVNIQDDEKDFATQDLLSMLGLSNTTSKTSSPSIAHAKTDTITDVVIPKESEIDTKENMQTVVNPLKSLEIQSNSNTDKEKVNVESEVDDESEDDDDDEEISSDETCDEVDEEILSEETDDEDVEIFYEDTDSDDDALLKEDMLVMNDYMEHIELDEGDDLNDLLAWSAMQDGNLALVSSDEEEVYDYASLDKKPAERTLSDFEEETAAILRQENKKISIEQDSRKKFTHKTKVDDTIIDPEVFGQTLKAALADVPPGLRPGMRRWYEKQQRNEERQKKKEEAKAHRRENKKNAKGKGKEESEEEFTTQMAKIDE